jgi:protein ImuB
VVPILFMFACIYIPDFPVEAIVRAEPMLRERAVAVLEGKPPLTRVVALNEKARFLGMEAGMTKLQAAVFAEKGNIPQSGTTNGYMAVLRQRSLEQEHATHGALLDIAHAFSPRVEDTAPDTLLLDLTGLERLYGSPATMGGALKSRVNAIGVESSIAVAANPNAALHAAHGFDGVTVIPDGSELQRLGVLPIQILLDAFEISSEPAARSKASERERQKLREQMLDTLERWGVRDFRTLALLPEHALASRLGQTGTQLRRLARGEGVRTLTLCEPPSKFEEAMELEFSVENIESLSFLLNRLLEQLCARLEARALAVQELQLRLKLEPRVADEQTTTITELKAPNPHNVACTRVFVRTLNLPVAMRNSKVFLKLLQLDLDSHPPGAPVTKIWISAEPAPPRAAQRGLFLPITPEPEKLEITLARIHAIVGERRAGIARLLDTHRPGAFQMQRFSPEETAKCTTLSDDNNLPPLAMRMIRPVYQIKVHLAEGRPASVEGQQSERTRLQGDVLWAAGPWRSSGDWWTDNKINDGPWDREEWDIALATSVNAAGQNVMLYRIYRDVSTGQWFADASYD